MSTTGTPADVLSLRERGPSDGRHGRSEALVRAYELVEHAQGLHREREVRSRLQVARRNQWWDVVFMLEFALLVGEPSAVNVTQRFEAMQDAARRSGDDALTAHLMATAACFDDSDLSQLARAVVLLDDLSGSVVHRPGAYVMCFVAYHRRGLWELAREMLDRVDVALTELFPPGLGPVAQAVRRAVITNRYESRVPAICLLLEAGDRESARREATAPAPDPDRLATLPAHMLVEVGAVRYLSTAVAGEPEPCSMETLLAQLSPLRRQGYRAMVLLGAALRARDAGDLARGAALAETALLHSDDEMGPYLTPLALHLVAGAAPDSPWRRYSEHQTRRRLHMREEVLLAARAQITVGRTQLDTDRSHRRAYLDELTGLANRHAYIRHLSLLRQRSDRATVAVVMMDIDHFKEVNDVHGHAVGDRVLRRLGEMLRALTRPEDLPVRLGGDEFLLLVETRNDQDASARAGRLLEQVRRTDWSALAPGLEVTISVGLAQGPAQEVNALLDAADQQLYAAKTQGRDRLVQPAAASAG